MTNDNTPNLPTEADLDRLLARIDEDLTITLARAASVLDEDAQQFAANYAHALHRMRRTLAMWQFEFGVTNQAHYRQTLLALAGDLTVSGLSAGGNQTSRAERTNKYLDHQRKLFKRLVMAKVIVNPSPGNQRRVLLDAQGKPMTKQ